MLGVNISRIDDIEYRNEISKTRRREQLHRLTQQ